MNFPTELMGEKPHPRSQWSEVRASILASMPGGQLDRVGAFSPVILTRILKHTADKARSGALQVASGPSVKTVHFDRGSVRFAASNIRRDRLGESMLAHEFISKEDYARAVLKMKTDRCRFGEALAAWALGWLAERAATPSRVLDLACGTGAATLRFAAAGCAAFGLDRSAAMLAASRSLCSRST